MNVSKAHLIIPVENQVREFDPKLLLACIAARRGYSSVIGSRLEIDFRIASFPQEPLSLQKHDGSQRQDVSYHAQTWS